LEPRAPSNEFAACGDRIDVENLQWVDDSRLLLQPERLMPEVDTLFEHLAHSFPAPSYPIF